MTKFHTNELWLFILKWQLPHNWELLKIKIKMEIWFSYLLSYVFDSFMTLLFTVTERERDNPFKETVNLLSKIG